MLKMGRKMAICPKCRSIDVSNDFSNAGAVNFGFLNRKKCNNCGYSGAFFPEVSEDEMVEKTKKAIRKTRRQ